MTLMALKVWGKCFAVARYTVAKAPLPKI